jgi:hypothetical protein
MDTVALPPDIPCFEIAMARFRAFIGQLDHHPRNLVWLFREDVTTNKRLVRIKIPLPVENEQIAKSRYEQGRSLGIGVCLDAFCWLESDLCCNTWFVRDLDESAQRLCYGLKLSVATDLPCGEPIQNWLSWKMRSWLDSKSGLDHFKGFLPSREENAD